MLIPNLALIALRHFKFWS